MGQATTSSETVCTIARVFQDSQEIGTQRAAFETSQPPLVPDLGNGCFCGFLSQPGGDSALRFC